MTQKELLTIQELDALSLKVGTKAEQWLEKKLKTPTLKKDPIKTAKRRPPKVVVNPFAGHLTSIDIGGQTYPFFAMDIIEGIARLDWHDRGIGQGGVSKPLSVSRIVLILDQLPEITTNEVRTLLNLGERHARRYVKAAELAIPYMLKCIPKSLRHELDGTNIVTEPTSEWEDTLAAPSPDELAKLHYDLRTFTEYGAASE
ncbi:hypothetical protein ACIGCM_01330 [Pseudomonas sp. NPDC078700]|uniref:hypothetical protein n=1 Tax=Pseudomonas sp. NPDC078700 TaxID=3364424 RepID=UPI0037C689ED